ncbi:MAG TPA: cytochrome P450 [Acidimicrobiales bacterium]|jgi:cytochrome P450
MIGDEIVTYSGFDHSLDPALLADHYAEWTRLQDVHRAFRSDINGAKGLWYLTRYDDIHEVFRDPERFSSRSIQYLDDDELPLQMVPIQMDPPEHGKYRSVLQGKFSPQAVAELEPNIRTRAAKLLGDFVWEGECDYSSEFAFRLPTAIFLEMMGLDVEHTDDFVALAKTLLHSTSASDVNETMTAAYQIIQHIANGLDERRANPRDDLLTVMVNGEVDGESIGDEHLVPMGFLLYIAGLDTVANVLTYSMHHLATNPDLRRSLVGGPSRWPSAVDEFLRYFSIASTVRVVTQDLEFAGCPMRAGDRVVLPTAAAGRDPRAFVDAAMFDADRVANRHVAFGAGPHRCLGAHLARLEMRIAMEEWHDHIPDYRVADDAVITEHVGAVAGMNELPLVWKT